MIVYFLEYVQRASPNKLLPIDLVLAQLVDNPLDTSGEPTTALCLLGSADNLVSESVFVQIGIPDMTVERIHVPVTVTVVLVAKRATRLSLVSLTATVSLSVLLALLTLLLLFVLKLSIDFFGRHILEVLAIQHEFRKLHFQFVFDYDVHGIISRAIPQFVFALALPL